MLSPSALYFPFCLFPLFLDIWEKNSLAGNIVVSSLVLNSVSSQEKKKKVWFFLYFLECFCDVHNSNACIGLRMQSLQQSEMLLLYMIL